jgi:hypothetical protein
VPVPEQIKIAFETTEGETKHRLISANYAEVTVDGDQQETEADPSKIPFVATIFPDTVGRPRGDLARTERPHSVVKALPGGRPRGVGCRATTVFTRA